MTDLTALPALLARVEAATGGDRELDRDLMLAIGGAREVDDYLFYGPGEIAWYFGPYEDDCNMPPLPHLTTSLDATVALVEKLRPGEFINVCGPFSIYWSQYPRPWQARFNDEPWRGYGHTEVLARLAALLRSMVEEEGK